MPDTPSRDSLPLYVSQTFPVGTSEHEATMTDWINAQAVRGYRVHSRQALQSNGLTRTVSVLLVREAEAVRPTTEGGAQ